MTEQPSLARQHLKRAYGIYRIDRAGAIKSLGIALELEVALAENEAVRTLAAAVTQLPADEALAVLADIKKREALILKYRKSAASRGFSARTWLAIGVAVLVVFGAVGVFILPTIIPTLLQNLQGGLPQVERRTLPDGGEYYVLPPAGRSPQTGWPALIIVHGEGQTGQQIISLLAVAAQSSSILLAAPTFTDADFALGYEGARGRVLAVLSHLEQRAYQDPRGTPHFLGQVYFGYDTGADFVYWLAYNGLDYSDTGFAIQLPLGVVLSPGLANLNTPPNIPYLSLDFPLTDESVGQMMNFVQQIYRSQ